MSADPIGDRALSRRRFLETTSTGFGMLALAGLTAETSMAGVRRAVEREAARRQAKHVIFCFMSGGVSQVDSFDPKPELERLHGQPMPVAVQRTQFNNNGNVMASPFRFNRHGESGLAVSSMFPHIATVADELAVIRSMTSSVNEHAQGNFLMHTGFPFLGHPSAGSWLHYGLGSASEDLPGFVVLQAGGRGASPRWRRALQQRLPAPPITRPRSWLPTGTPPSATSPRPSVRRRSVASST